VFAVLDRQRAAALAEDPEVAVVAFGDDAGDVSERRLAELLRAGGPVRSQRLVPAQLQHAEVWTWPEDCWKCRRRYTAVTASGTWRAVCGRSMGRFDLDDDRAAPALAAAFAAPASPVRARLVRHRSKTTGSTHWLNQCPHCGSVLGHFFAWRISIGFLDTSPEHLIPIDARPPQRESPHWCVGDTRC
jgi:hypothetical protein